jgi:hypothetical protein
MTIFFVTTGPWGAGTGTPLAAAQVDGNFYDVDQRIVDMAVDLAEGKRIDTVTYTDTSMTFHFTDATSQTIPLPIATLTFVGEWTNSTPYLRGHMISAGSGLFQVLEDHTTPPVPALFDPNATDESTAQNPLYQLFMTVVSVPIGGETGQFLRKVTSADYAVDWGDAALDDLSDVEIPTAPADGDVLIFSGGFWIAASIPEASILLSQLGDVDIVDDTATPLSTGHVLTWNGSVWTNEDPAFNPTMITPVAGQIITYEDGEWKNSSQANLPVLSGVSVFGPLTLDYEDGAVQRVTMTNGVTLNPIINWPPAGQFGRLVLEVRNNGAYTWEWPVAYKWPGGSEPTVSTSGRDIFALTTFDGGITVDGSIIGQNYL